MTDAAFDGRIVVVTGGALGIGGAVTRAFAEAGATVVCVDYDDEGLQRVIETAGAARGRVVGVHGDVRDAAVVSRAYETAISAGGQRIDVLVNNVGDFRPPGRFVKTTEDDWQVHYETNLKHVFRMTHAVLPSMIEQRQGCIINNATVEAFRGIPGNVVYSAFKAAVVAFTRSLAVEVGPHGVRVNAIAPDLADTPQTPAAAMLRGRDPALVPRWVPLGRFGAPDDYAQVVLFLAGEQARFVTGHTVPIDGGTLAASGWYGRADGKGWTNLPDAP